MGDIVKREDTPAPAPYTGGAIESYFDRKRWERQSRAVNALTTLNQSEVLRRQSLTKLVEAEVEHRRALVKLKELPEIIGHEVAVRRVQRADSYRAAEHVFQMNEKRRQNELMEFEVNITHTKIKLTHAMTALTDAQQQLKAQQEFGHSVYELEHKKRIVEALGLELDVAERRALLKKHITELDQETDTAVKDLLSDYRELLRANNLDTSKLDAILK